MITERGTQPCVLTEEQKQTIVPLVEGLKIRMESEPTEMKDLSVGAHVVSLSLFKRSPDASVAEFAAGMGIGLVAKVETDRIEVKFEEGDGRTIFIQNPGFLSHNITDLVVLTQNESNKLLSCGYYIPTLTD